MNRNALLGLMSAQWCTTTHCAVLPRGVVPDALEAARRTDVQPAAWPLSRGMDRQQLNPQRVAPRLPS